MESRIDPATGEVQRRSGAVYYRDPELTRQAFTADRWLPTGDKGTGDAEGNLTITGRVEDHFKTSKGKHVAPALIEDRLAVHPVVEACCVTGANHAQPLGLVALNADAANLSADPAGRRRVEQSLEAHLDQLNQRPDPQERLECLVAMTEAWTIDDDLITPPFKVRRNRVDKLFAGHYARWAGSRRKVVWPKV